MDWMLIAIAVGFILTGTLIGGVIVHAIDQRTMRMAPPTHISKRCDNPSHRRRI